MDDQESLPDQSRCQSESFVETDPEMVRLKEKLQNAQETIGEITAELQMETAFLEETKTLLKKSSIREQKLLNDIEELLNQKRKREEEIQTETLVLKQECEQQEKELRENVALAQEEKRKREKELQTEILILEQEVEKQKKQLRDYDARLQAEKREIEEEFQCNIIALKQECEQQKKELRENVAVVQEEQRKREEEFQIEHLALKQECEQQKKELRQNVAVVQEEERKRGELQTEVHVLKQEIEKQKKELKDHDAEVQAENKIIEKEFQTKILAMKQECEKQKKALRENVAVIQEEKRKREEEFQFENLALKQECERQSKELSQNFAVVQEEESKQLKKELTENLALDRENKRQREELQIEIHVLKQEVEKQKKELRDYDAQVQAEKTKREEELHSEVLVLKQEVEQQKKVLREHDARIQAEKTKIERELQTEVLALKQEVEQQKKLLREHDARIQAEITLYSKMKTLITDSIAEEATFKSKIKEHIAKTKLREETKTLLTFSINDQKLRRGIDEILIEISKREEEFQTKFLALKQEGEQKKKELGECYAVDNLVQLEKTKIERELQIEVLVLKQEVEQQKEVLRENDARIQAEMTLYSKMKTLITDSIAEEATLKCKIKKHIAQTKLREETKTLLTELSVRDQKLLSEIDEVLNLIRKREEEFQTKFLTLKQEDEQKKKELRGFDAVDYLVQAEKPKREEEHQTEVLALRQECKQLKKVIRENDAMVQAEKSKREEKLQTKVLTLKQKCEQLKKIIRENDAMVQAEKTKREKELQSEVLALKQEFEQQKTKMRENEALIQAEKTKTEKELQIKVLVLEQEVELQKKALREQDVRIQAAMTLCLKLKTLITDSIVEEATLKCKIKEDVAKTKLREETKTLLTELSVRDQKLLSEIEEVHNQIRKTEEEFQTKFLALKQEDEQKQKELKGFDAVDYLVQEEKTNREEELQTEVLALKQECEQLKKIIRENDAKVQAEKSKREEKLQTEVLSLKQECEQLKKIIRESDTMVQAEKTKREEELQSEVLALKQELEQQKKKMRENEALIQAEKTKTEKELQIKVLALKQEVELQKKALREQDARIQAAMALHLKLKTLITDSIVEEATLKCKIKEHVAKTKLREETKTLLTELSVRDQKLLSEIDEVLNQAPRKKKKKGTKKEEKEKVAGEREEERASRVHLAIACGVFIRNIEEEFQTKYLALKQKSEQEEKELGEFDPVDALVHAEKTNREEELETEVLALKQECEQLKKIIREYDTMVQAEKTKREELQSEVLALKQECEQQKKKTRENEALIQPEKTKREEELQTKVLVLQQEVEQQEKVLQEHDTRFQAQTKLREETKTWLKESSIREHKLLNAIDEFLNEKRKLEAELQTEILALKQQSEQQKKELREYEALIQAEIPDRKLKLPNKSDPEPDFTASIDFGTSYCSWSLTETVPNENSEPSSQAVASKKVPTSALIEPDGKTLRAFGHDAESFYKDLAVKGQHRDHYYFLRFKTALDTETIAQDVMIEDIMGKLLPAKNVFALSFEYIRDEVIEMGKNAGRKDVTVKDIYWALSVPAVWSDEAKQFMRTVAEEASMEPNLRIGYNTEVTALSCRNVADTTDGIAENFEAGARYMILDAGGGKVQLSVQEVGSSGELTEITATTGHSLGGHQVNKAFEDILVDVFGLEIYTAFKENNTSDWLQLLLDFEEIKKPFDPATLSGVEINIPSTLIGHTKSDLQQLIDKSKYSTDLEARGTVLKIGSKLMASLFDKPLRETVELVKSGLQLVNGDTVIYTVGGFSASRSLQQAIEQEFPDLKIVSPITLKKTYGIEMYEEFRAGVHPESKQKVVDGKKFCEKVFSKYVEKGQIITAGKRLKEESYGPAADNQEAILFNLFSSDKKDPKYTDDGCTKIGNLRLNIADVPGNLDRHIFVSMTFGETEITATARADKTGKSVTVSCDFLG